MGGLPLTRADWKLLAAAVVIGVLTLGGFRLSGTMGREKPGVLVVETAGRETMRVSTTGSRRQIRLSKVGMTLEVGEGRARVLRSDCPEQICVSSGWIGRPGQTIVCVPNRTVLRLVGKGGPDAISQ